MPASCRWLCCASDALRHRPHRLAAVQPRCAARGSLLRSQPPRWSTCGRKASTAYTPTTTGGQQRERRQDTALLCLLPLVLLTPTPPVCLPASCSHRVGQMTAAGAAPELRVGLPNLLITFVPRPAVTEALHHALGSCSDRRSCSVAWSPSSPHHADCCVAVLHGTGGAGKTLLALHHARLERCAAAPYSLRWWIAAEQRAGLQAQYQLFAQRACVPVDARINSDFPALVAAVNDWLSARRDWLVVFDNVQSYDDIATIIPHTPLPGQHVIITSRQIRSPAAYRIVSVDVMDKAQAMQLLKEGADIAADDQSQDADISRLADELGNLPLALSHAAAYVKRQCVTLAVYRTRYMETSLLDNKRVNNAIGDPYPHAVAQTWDMSIAAVDEEAKREDVPVLGRALLTACAYLNPDGIPRSLLRRWLSSSGLLTAADDVQAVVDTLLAMLSSYSLLLFADRAKSVVRLHRVLGRVLRHQHQHPQQLQQAAAASDCLTFNSAWRAVMVAAVIDEFDESSPVFGLKDMTQFPHLQSVKRCFDKSGAGSGWDASLACADLLFRLAGAALYRFGDYEQGKQHAERAVAIYTREYDAGDVRLAHARFRLALARGGLCDQRQRSLMELVLFILGTQPGKRDELAVALAGLDTVCRAPSHDDAGEGSSALSLLAMRLLQRSLPLPAAHRGADRRTVAATLSYLGNACCVLGDGRTQWETLDGALAARRARFSEEHAEVAFTFYSLAEERLGLKDDVKAIGLLEAAMQMLRGAYGNSHLLVGFLLHSLAVVHGQRGERGRQRVLLLSALSIIDSQLGGAHPWVAAINDDIASLQQPVRS